MGYTWLFTINQLQIFGEQLFSRLPLQTPGNILLLNITGKTPAKTLTTRAISLWHSLGLLSYLLCVISTAFKVDQQWFTHSRKEPSSQEIWCPSQHPSPLLLYPPPETRLLQAEHTTEITGHTLFPQVPGRLSVPKMQEQRRSGFGGGTTMMGTTTPPPTTKTSECCSKNKEIKEWILPGQSTWIHRLAFGGSDSLPWSWTIIIWCAQSLETFISTEQTPEHVKAEANASWEWRYKKRLWKIIVLKFREHRASSGL